MALLVSTMNLDVWKYGFDNSTSDSYNSYLYKTILRNMILASGLRQRYHGNICILSTFINSTMNTDAYKWCK